MAPSFVNRLASLLLAGGLVAACSDAENQGSPGGAAGAAQGPGGASGQAGSSPQAGTGQGGEVPGGAAGAAGAVRRTVEQRPVLGRALAGNLFFDGDFELTRTGSMAPSSWLTVSKSGNRVDLSLETGGACRSGLLCAKLAAGQQAVALGASASGASMAATVQIKPLDTKASCAKVNASLVSCLSLYESSANVFSADFTLATTDEQGWCTFEASIGPQVESICMVIENDSPGALLVDDATLLGVTTKQQTTTLGPATHAQLALIERLRPAVRQQRQRTTPPTPGVPRLDPVR